MRLTFHGTLLGVILIVLAMMAIGPARQLYDEQQAVRTDRATLAAGTAESNRLATRLQQLQDPNFVEQLARQELGYVSPGETSYVVPQSGSASSLQASLQSPSGSAPATTPKARTTSWLGRIWNDLT
jgi:cell division protein FtsB